MYGKVSGSHKGGVNSVCQVKRDLILGTCLYLLAGWGKGSTEEQWLLPALPSLERAAMIPAPPALALSVPGTF